MLRANSLKKALRQIIEQAEKGSQAASRPLFLPSFICGCHFETSRYWHAVCSSLTTRRHFSVGRAEQTHAGPEDAVLILHQKREQ